MSKFSFRLRTNENETARSRIGVPKTVPNFPQNVELMGKRGFILKQVKMVLDKAKITYIKRKNKEKEYH